MRVVTSTSQDGYEVIRARIYSVLALVAFVTGLVLIGTVTSPTVDAAWWQHLLVAFSTAVLGFFMLFLGSVKYPGIHTFFAGICLLMAVAQVIAALIDIFQAVSNWM
jgi:hypothetical protein